MTVSAPVGRFSVILKILSLIKAQSLSFTAYAGIKLSVCRPSAEYYSQTMLSSYRMRNFFNRKRKPRTQVPFRSSHSLDDVWEKANRGFLFAAASW